MLPWISSDGRLGGRGDLFYPLVFVFLDQGTAVAKPFKPLTPGGFDTRPTPFGLTASDTSVPLLIEMGKILGGIALGFGSHTGVVRHHVEMTNAHRSRQADGEPRHD